MDNRFVRNKKANKYMESYVCPYTITQMWTNRDVTKHQGAIKYCMNVRWIKLYHE